MTWYKHKYKGYFDSADNIYNLITIYENKMEFGTAAAQFHLRNCYQNHNRNTTNDLNYE